MDRRGGCASAFVAGCLLVTAFLRLMTAIQENAREEEIARGRLLVDQALSAPPAPVETALRPATVAPRAPSASPVPESTEGWVLDDVTAWCADGRWAGRATVRATTRTPRTWSFVVTLLDGRRPVARLDGASDHTAFMDENVIRLASRDACREGRFRYVWGVAP